MNDSSSVLLAPGEGARGVYEDGRAVVTYKGYGVRFGEAFDENSWYVVNVSGEDQILYLDPPTSRSSSVGRARPS